MEELLKCTNCQHEISFAELQSQSSTIANRAIACKDWSDVNLECPSCKKTLAEDTREYVEQACAEMALAKATNQIWTKSEGMIGKHDRAYWSADEEGPLILQKMDYNDHRYFLVTGELGAYEIHGYIWGRDGKKHEFWSKQYEYYEIPVSKLVPYPIH